MIKIKLKLLGPIFLGVLGILVLWMWDYANGLYARFPDMDFSRSRLGIASWYSKSDPNIREFTASGEKFNDQELTCASWNFPFNEKLLVVNTLNGKWVVCRVNDRGPNKRLRRTIDLTKAAFRKIADTDRGLICVAVIPTSKRYT